MSNTKKKQSEGKIITGVTLVAIRQGDGAQLYEWGSGSNDCLWLCGRNCASNVKVGDVGRLIYRSTASEGLWWFEKADQIEFPPPSMEKTQRIIQAMFPAQGSLADIRGYSIVTKTTILEAMVKRAANEITQRGYQNAYDLELTLTRILSSYIDQLVARERDQCAMIAHEEKNVEAGFDEKRSGEEVAECIEARIRALDA